MKRQYSEKAKPRVMMHVIDAGQEHAQFRCRKCGLVSGWLYCATTTEGKRGIPCETCNKQEPTQ